jgi:hypothetical protein
MRVDREDLKAAVRYGLKWYCIFWGGVLATVAVVHGVVALLR